MAAYRVEVYPMTDATFCIYIPDSPPRVYKKYATFVELQEWENLYQAQRTGYIHEDGMFIQIYVVSLENMKILQKETYPEYFLDHA